MKCLAPGVSFSQAKGGKEGCGRHVSISAEEQKQMFLVFGVLKSTSRSLCKFNAQCPVSSAQCLISLDQMQEEG